MLEWWNAAFAALSALVTLLVFLQAQRERRQQGRRKERNWRDILEWTRVVEDEDASPTLRALAKEALRASGVTEETIAEIARREHQDALARLFKPQWEPPQEEIDAVVRVLDTPIPDVPPEVQGPVLDFVWRLERAFQRSKELDRPEDDTRVRIFTLLMIYIMAFGSLIIAAIGRALGT